MNNCNLFIEDEIVSIETMPFEGEVFNLSVGEDESYILNNVTCHNCLCFVTSVQMSDEAFAQRMRGFINNPASWPKMERYADRMGSNPLRVGLPDLLAGLEDTLYKWTFDLPQGTQPYLPGMGQFFESVNLKWNLREAIQG